MNMGVNKLLVMAVSFALLMMAGCQKKPAQITCKNDADCHMSRNGNEINGVCHMGTCEECVSNEHCSDLKQCVSNRCLASCKVDTDCGSNQHCKNNYCEMNCESDANCRSGESCALGRCLSLESSDLGSVGGSECANLDKVLFDFDSFAIRADFRDQIRKLTQCMVNNPSLSLSIAGHTDDRGTPSYNMVLGEKRAMAIKKHLEGEGIAASRVKTISYGEKMPEVSESNENAWEKNRRAEFKVESN